MFKLRSSILGLALATICGSVHALEWTAANNIGVVIMDGNYYYISSASGTGWGPVSCPTTTYLYVPRSEAHARELLSMVFFAKANNRQLMAWGACHATYPNTYFSSTYFELL